GYRGLALEYDHLDISDLEVRHKWCPSFFFQAEDGIRDGHVTGVQTCALPILAMARAENAIMEMGSARSVEQTDRSLETFRQKLRSEERRVGKECRSRCARYH